MGLDTFVVTMRDEDPPAVRFQPGAVDEGFELDLHDVQAVEGYRAAVAAPPSITTASKSRRLLAPITANPNASAHRSIQAQT